MFLIKIPVKFTILTIINKLKSNIFIFLFVLLFNILSNAQSYQNAMYNASIDVVNNYYAILNNYCSFDFSIAERTQFKLYLLNNVLSDDCSICNDISSTGSDYFSANDYLDALLAWYPISSSHFEINDISIVKSSIDLKGIFVFVAFNRKFSGLSNTNKQIVNTNKIVVSVFFPKNDLTKGKIKSIDFYSSPTPPNHTITPDKTIKPKMITWDKTFGGEYSDEAFSIIQTFDGGFAIAGITKSKGNGEYDAWIIKTDSEGNMLWDKTFGGFEWDFVFSIVQTADGGVAIAGYTESKGNGNKDAWILKLDREGNILWDRTYGSDYSDVATSIIQTFDGGFAIAGSTEIKGNGNKDAWILKLDREGNILWDRTYGGDYSDVATSIIQTIDGGFSILGNTESKGIGQIDAWIIKTDSKGNMIWDRTYGGDYLDVATSIIQTFDGGFAIAGSTESKGNGHDDAWILKTNREGNMIWDKTFGGEYWDEAFSIIQTIDGGFAIAGSTESKGNDNEDAWIIKTDNEGNILWDRTYGGDYSGRATSIIQTIDGGFAIAGSTESKGNGKEDAWIFKIDQNGNIK